MSLDGLRAWIGEVERKLGVRTRVFLVLTAIAVGGAGAGIYLALDEQSDRVTESDLQAVQEDLQAQIDALDVQTSSSTGATEADPRVEELERQVAALQAQVEGSEGEESGKAGGKDEAPSGGSATEEKEK